MTNKVKALVEECRLDAKAFRENTVYDSDGDPIRLIANADRLDQYADRIEAFEAALRDLVEAVQRRATDLGGYDGRFGLNKTMSKARAALAGDSHD